MKKRGALIGGDLLPMHIFCRSLIHNSNPMKGNEKNDEKKNMQLDACLFDPYVLCVRREGGGCEHGLCARLFRHARCRFLHSDGCENGCGLI